MNILMNLCINEASCMYDNTYNEHCCLKVMNAIMKLITHDNYTMNMINDSYF